MQTSLKVMGAMAATLLVNLGRPPRRTLQGEAVPLILQSATTGVDPLTNE